MDDRLARLVGAKLFDRIKRFDGKKGTVRGRAARTPGEVWRVFMVLRELEKGE